MSNHFYYDYPFIMRNLPEGEYSFSLLLSVTSFIIGPSLLCYKTCRYSPCPALVTTIHSSSSSISLTFIFNVTITMIG